MECGIMKRSSTYAEGIRKEDEFYTFTCAYRIQSVGWIQ